MGHIFYIMGKSATGKDTLYKRIREELPDLKTVIPYTTRPIRREETDGVEYHFITQDLLQQMQEEGRVIEMRTYQTVFGPWSYATVQDGQIDLEKENYLLIGTLESYQKIRDYFGERVVVPLYIEVEDGERLSRALMRERQQEKPRYEELCRRFLADSEDFKSEKLEQARIGKHFNNQDFSQCLSELLSEIHHYALI